MKILLNIWHVTLLGLLVCDFGLACAQANELNELAYVKLHIPDICEAPYFADSTGKQDCTESILRALDDVTKKTQFAWQQTLEEPEALPQRGFDKSHGQRLGYVVPLYR